MAQPAQAPSDDVQNILATIASLGKQFTSGNAGSRDELIEAARSLITAVELPSQACFRMVLAEPARNMAIRVANELSILEQLRDSGGKAKSSTELAKRGNADPTLVSRIVKHLAAMQIIREEKADAYLPTPLTAAYADAAFRGCFKFGGGPCGNVFQALPDYLSSISYANPSDDKNGPWQFALNTKLLHWDWMVAHPEMHRAFNDYESGYHAGRPFWASLYPIRERLLDGFDSNIGEGVLLVDQGGGKGHDLEEFAQKVPEYNGRLVLQDLPDVIEHARHHGLSDKVECMNHDMFTEQPIKAPRAIFMHSVLHDWNDVGARSILRNLRPAMKPGYSRLLIHEQIVPAAGASWKITAHDLIMMGNFASHERSLAQWETLLKAEGFEITGVWSDERDGAAESIVEAMVVVKGA